MTMREPEVTDGVTVEGVTDEGVTDDDGVTAAAGVTVVEGVTDVAEVTDGVFDPLPCLLEPVSTWYAAGCSCGLGRSLTGALGACEAVVLPSLRRLAVSVSGCEWRWEEEECECAGAEGEEEEEVEVEGGRVREMPRVAEVGEEVFVLLSLFVELEDCC
jgi:hypothetical protein